MKNLDYQKLAGVLGRILPARLLAAGNEGWAWGAGLLGVTAVALALAQLTWRLVPAPQEGGAAPSALSRPSRGGAAPLTITELVGGHLFGQPLAAPNAAVNAPETTLNLTLRGIFALDNARALAIIASGGSDEQPYKLGDAVPGGAKVHEIVADRVILERGGRFETLALPKDTLESNNVAPAGQGGPGPTAARLGEIRNRLKANPSEVLGMNAVQPVMENGQLKGYKLADNPYTPVLREAGLMPEDVVTQVNGIPVTDQARGPEMLNLLSSAGRIELVVERGGVPTNLSVELGR